MKKIKILFLLLVLILSAIKLSAQTETWNVVNKSMGQWNDYPADASNSYGWGTVPVNGSPSGDPTTTKEAFAKFITQWPEFVRLQKPAFPQNGAGSGAFYLNPNIENKTSGTFHTAVKTNTDYVIELKIQIFAPVAGDADANEVRARLGGRSIDFFISYGDGITGYVGKTSRGTDFPIDPTLPHVYRVEYAANTGYDLYVDNILAFNETTPTSSGANILVIGAALTKSCHLDLYRVRMKTAESPTWDVLNKYLDQWNGNHGGWNVTSIADWEICQNADLPANGAGIEKISESGVDFLRISKTSADNDFYLSTPATVADQIGEVPILDTEAYTVDVKARIPENAANTANTVNIIKVKLFNKIMAIVLSEGTIANGVKHPTKTGIVAGEEKTLPTTGEWNTYRLTMNSEQTIYNIYVNRELTFSNLPTLDDDPGKSYIRLGGESFSSSELDVAAVKMGSGDFNSNQEISPWNIIDKPMSAWNINGGSNLNQAWTFTKSSQGSIPAAAVTQETDYVNISKTHTWNAYNYGFLTPPALTLSENTAYTFEIKARLHAIDKELWPDITPPETGEGGFESNQISARLNNKNLAIHLKYGTDNEGSISIGDAQNPVEKYILNTADWHRYRIVLHADNAAYDVYIDDMNDPIFENIATIATSGSNILRLGAETNHRCNIDIEYAKMGNGELIHHPKITVLNVNLDSHEYGKDNLPVEVTVATALMPENQKLTLELIDELGISQITPLELTVSGNSASETLIVPPTLPIGKYFIQIAVAGGEIDGVAIKPKKIQYIVADESPLRTKLFPQVKPVGWAVAHINDYQYKNTSNEFIFPSIVDTKPNTVDGKFTNGAQPLARYYLFYAPHENPGGIYLATSNSLDGPWTEQGIIASLDWAHAVPNNIINTASHISACHVFWNTIYNEYIMYFHGPNSTTHFATSQNLLEWTFGGTILSARQFSPQGEECSYGKCFEHPIPGLGNKYIFLMMNQEGQIRRIRWAYSQDGKSWTPVQKPLVSPDLPWKKIPGTQEKPNYAGTFGTPEGNLAAPYLIERNGRTFILCHGSSGNLYCVEVGPQFDREIHWGEYIRASDVEIDANSEGQPLAVPRIASPQFTQNDAGIYYLFFEAGSRLGANIAFAREDGGQTTTPAPSAKSAELSIYPTVLKSGRPLTVHASSSQPIQLKIFNAQGRHQLSAKLKPTDRKLDLKLPPGLYFAKATIAGTQTRGFRIIITD
jgi:hypothetical protein